MHLARVGARTACYLPNFTQFEYPSNRFFTRLALSDRRNIHVSPWWHKTVARIFPRLSLCSGKDRTISKWMYETCVSPPSETGQRRPPQVFWSEGMKKMSSFKENNSRDIHEGWNHSTKNKYVLMYWSAQGATHGGHEVSLSIPRNRWLDISRWFTLSRTKVLRVIWTRTEKLNNRERVKFYRGWFEMAVPFVSINPYAALSTSLNPFRVSSKVWRIQSILHLQKTNNFIHVHFKDTFIWYTA